MLSSDDQPVPHPQEPKTGCFLAKAMVCLFQTRRPEPCQESEATLIRLRSSGTLVGTIAAGDNVLLPVRLFSVCRKVFLPLDNQDGIFVLTDQPGNRG